MTTSLIHQHIIPKSFLYFLVKFVHIPAMKSKKTEIESLHPRGAPANVKL